MGVFDAIEKKLEGAVSSVFAKAFKGEVQPVEITARLQREMDSEATVLDKDRKLAPNGFHVSLSTHDFARLIPYSKTMNAEISAQLSAYALEHDYVLNGTISIDYEEDEKLPIGKMRVVATSEASVASDEQIIPPRRNSVFVEVNGVRHPLIPGSLTIGRGNEVDLRINDPGISREHARIDAESSGMGLAIKITDLGSTNGLKVNGQKTPGAPLIVGSVVDIGKTQLKIVAGADA
ncbi:MAG: DUF3662 and FHA domain-containing protein [Propionibacteriaceae bacterium]|jgi:hypothetical protein|nr:DUF3662 and FHA domain-containing protein [Propionibacteriaceae bacterium]